MAEDSKWELTWFVQDLQVLFVAARGAVFKVLISRVCGNILQAVILLFPDRDAQVIMRSRGMGRDHGRWAPSLDR